MHDPGESANRCTAGVYMVSGRRSGKSFISSLVVTYLACFSNYGKQLSAGERAVILVLAIDRDQGRVCFAYIAGIIREIAPLAAMVPVNGPMISNSTTVP